MAVLHRQRCWICGSPRTRRWRERTAPTTLRTDDLRITDASYGTTLALRRCDDCGFVFADEVADLHRLDALYRELDDPAYLESGAARRRQMRWILRVIGRAQPGARRLLDVGTGSGLLVAEAARAGLEAVGVEPSVRLAEAARAQDGVRVLTGTLPHPALAAERFDVVTLVDVIEHVRDPLALLRSAAAHLAPDGVLVVVTPDVGSVVARLLGRRWWHNRPAHVGYFSASSLTRAAREAGLDVVLRRRPLWWLPIGYAAARVAVYLPRSMRVGVGRIFSPLSALQHVAVPLDSRDSLFYLLRHTPSP